jgi:hypothetical protein
VTLKRDERPSSALAAAFRPLPLVAEKEVLPEYPMIEARRNSSEPARWVAVVYDVGDPKE